jgi:hypothetical protein
MILIPFLSGAVTMGFCAIALFFLRFWRSSRDPLFLCFSLAFLLLGLVQGALTISGAPLEERSPFYLVRFAAFMLIIVAVVRKNRAVR